MLEVHDLGVRYGRHIALHGVSLRIARGEICVMLGANGAGKSSLLKAIAGIVGTEPGTRIVMNGRSIAGMKAHRIVEEGIALVPEGRGIFGELTVAENLRLGAFAARARQGEAETLRRIYALFPRLAERKGQIARTMSGGEQQMVAIGRALMSKPDILMLDEPSLGLSPLLSKELFKSLKAVAASGVGILLVEQNARLSLKIADRGYLVENGLITGEDTAVALMNDPAVVNAYLGGARPEGGSRTARRGIALPPFLALPGSLEAMGPLMGDLARRAGAIQSAFVRHLRRHRNAPSAFAGRYDPIAGVDPWTELMEIASAPRPAATARIPVAVDAAGLAARAADRLARHVAARRSGSADAVVARPIGAAAPRRAVLDLDAAALARGAAERLALHVRSRRRPPEAARPQPAARHGLLGHNSAGIDIDADDLPAAAPPEPAVPPFDLLALASRAASIQQDHVARRRRSLTAFTISPHEAATVAASPKAGKQKSSKKRKKHKEA